MDTLVEWARTALTGYSKIKKRDKMLIDFIGMNPVSYSIRTEPNAPIVKRYMNGDTVRAFNFALEGRFDTLSDADRANNNKLYQGLALWLEEQTRKRLLPVMNNNAKPMSIEAVGGVYLSELDEDGDSGIYLMQIQIIYYQKAR